MSKVVAAMEATRERLDAWEAEEFQRSVRIFKESKEAIWPIVDQLREGNDETARRDSTAAAEGNEVRERCLRVLQALVRAEPSLQGTLNDMGVKPRDLIVILQAMRSSGALHAEVVTL